MKLFDLACRTPWAILPDTLTTILEVAHRENLSVEAVETQLGRPLDNTHTVTTRDGVASIPIDGPIFRHANLFTQISGATSIEILAQDLHSALIDPAIRAIVLAIDSPGGEVNGVNEFADMIYAARGQKPIVSYVSHLGASAAYWIASAADAIVLDATAAVGSIGVVAAVRDPTKERARDIEFVSSQSPNKRPDPTTEKGKAQVQGTVDALADVFIASVARHRGVDASTIAADFGAGGIVVGQQAVDAGMADAVGSYEGVLRALAAGEPVLPLSIAPPPDDPPAAISPPAQFTGEHPMPDEKKPDAQPVPTAANDATLTAMQEQFAQMQSQFSQQASQFTEIKGALEGRIADLESKNQALMGNYAAERTKRLQSEAVAFADAQIAAGKAVPYERETLATRYLVAVEDDAQRGPLALSEDRQVSRIELLTTEFAHKTAHGLTQEQMRLTGQEGEERPPSLFVLPNLQKTPAAGGDAAPSPEALAALLKMSDLGRRAAAAQNGK